MANLIGIMGEPGSGKSTSLRNLNPEETYYCEGPILTFFTMPAIYRGH